MAEERYVRERVVERATPHTTVVERRGGGAGLVIGLALLVAVALLAWFLLAENRNDTIRTNAVAGAAESVERTADKVGEAVDGATN
jgi:hypothetical protein